jgi:hypothetical protein
MACGIFSFFNRGCEDRCKACSCGLSACGCDGGCGCGCKKDDKKVAIITAIRAIAANGDGVFDKVNNW